MSKPAVPPRSASGWDLHDALGRDAAAHRSVLLAGADEEADGAVPEREARAGGHPEGCPAVAARPELPRSRGDRLCRPCEDERVAHEVAARVDDMDAQHERRPARSDRVGGEDDPIDDKTHRERDARARDRVLPVREPNGSRRELSGRRRRRGGGGGRTGDLHQRRRFDVVAVAVPDVLRAVTWTRSRRPRSVCVTMYCAIVAPVITAQPAPVAPPPSASQRSHSYVYVSGVVPVQSADARRTGRRPPAFPKIEGKPGVARRRVVGVEVDDWTAARRVRRGRLGPEAVRCGDAEANRLSDVVARRGM